MMQMNRMLQMMVCTEVIADLERENLLASGELLHTRISSR
jgi:hypothetical protein